MINKEQDPMGQAISNFFHQQDETPVRVTTNITFEEELPVHYLFRTYNEMPLLEQKAMDLVKGSVLDVGAGAGAHSVYLKEQNFKVTSIDVSELSCDVMKARGLETVSCSNIWTLTPQVYDTVLFMMNGIGLVKTLKGLEAFFEHLKKYVAVNGQVLLDSSDLKYLFEEEDGAYWVDLNTDYYGELKYNLEYKDVVAEPFFWLFVDFNKLKVAAEKCNWQVELIYQDDHFQYLVKLTISS
jgi:SAM-dependent methyltransferase